MKTSLFSILCGVSLVTTAQAVSLTTLNEETAQADNYAINFSYDQTYTHGSRHLNGIALNSPTYGYQSVNISASSTVYNLISEQQFVILRLLIQLFIRAFSIM